MVRAIPRRARRHCRRRRRQRPHGFPGEGAARSACAVHAADMARLGGIVGDAALDLIVSSLALHYVADLPPLFAEWARVLKRGGILVLSTHHPLYDLERLR